MVIEILRHYLIPTSYLRLQRSGVKWVKYHAIINY